MSVGGAARAEKCPVCQASFRGAEICPRCGADLGLLMLIAAHAHSLRTVAKEHLLTGETQAALAAAEAAQHLQATPHGGILLRVCQGVALQSRPQEDAGKETREKATRIAPDSLTRRLGGV